MTDIYKKLYGYEDDIQLKDDDIKLLEAGMTLKKMNRSKEDFNDRFYRLDLNNNQLVANTKEFRKKEKLCWCFCLFIRYIFGYIYNFFEIKLDSLVSLNEVKSGCSSDDLKTIKLKKGLIDKKKADEMVCIFKLNS
jgi:hypothetical protein